MIRKIALGAAAALLVVGLPVAALGISNSLSSNDAAQEQVTAAVTAPNTGVAVSRDQTQVRQQLRLHAETGIPEGVTPTQTRRRLHTQNQDATQSPTGEQGRGRGHGQGHQGTEAGNGSGNQFGRGNGGGHQGNGGEAGHNGDGTGECTNPDGPVGNGPNGTSN